MILKSIDIPEYVKTVLTALTQAGFSAFIVGGCVRDSLLGAVPSDWDVCTDARPQEIKKSLSGITTIDTGIKHGTVTAVVKDRHVEITTFRADGKYLDHRRPETIRAVSSLTEDLARRDFTINAMAYSQKSGITDAFGGQTDLKNGVIKCVGSPEERFEEDALRILRAVRFASTLGFSIEEKTKEAVFKKLPLLDCISKERIRDELLMLLCGKNAVSVLRDFHSVVTYIIPELLPCIGEKQNTPHHCYDVYEHTIRAVGGSPKVPEIRMAALLHDIGKPFAKTTDACGTDHFKGHPLISARISKEILTRLKFSNKQKERIIHLVKEHDNRFPAERKSVRKFISKYSYDFFMDYMSIRYADTLAQSDYKRKEKLSQIDLCRQLGEDIRASHECLKLKDLAVNGADIMALGFSGKEIGDILSLCLEKILNDELSNNKHGIIDFVKDFQHGKKG